MIYQQVMLFWFALVLVWGFVKGWKMFVASHRAESYGNGYAAGKRDGRDAVLLDEAATYNRGYLDGIIDDRIGEASSNLSATETRQVAQAIGRYNEMKRRRELLHTAQPIDDEDGEVVLTAPNWTLATVPADSVNNLIEWQKALAVQAGIAKAILENGGTVDLVTLGRDIQAIRERYFEASRNDYVAAAAMVTTATIKYANDLIGGTIAA